MLSGILFDESKTRDFRLQLKEHFSVSLHRLCSKALGIGAVLSLAALAAGFFLGLGLEAIVLAFAAALFAPLTLSLLYYSYLLERRKRALESEAPMVLLQASVFPRGTPVSSIVSYLARKENGLLGREFLKAKREIARGSSMEKALKGLGKRNKSAVIARLAEMLLIAYESGAWLGESFRELAEELLEMKAMLAEKKAALAIERITLLAGSALIVPFILGVLVGMVFEFDFGEIEIAGFSSQGQREELLAAAPIANNLYIIEYALIASVFLGWLDGRQKKAFVYALALVPASSLVFAFSQGLSVV